MNREIDQIEKFKIGENHLPKGNGLPFKNHTLNTVGFYTSFVFPCGISKPFTNPCLINLNHVIITNMLLLISISTRVGESLIKKKKTGVRDSNSSFPRENT